MGDITQGRSLPDDLLGSSVQLRDGRSVELGSLIHAAPTALVFIRHFGCLGCSVHMADLAPRLEEMKKLGLEVVLVGNGAPNFIEGFIERFRLDEKLVTITTDPSLKTHQAAQLKRSFWATLGPKGIVDQLRALLGGHRQNHIQGDNWQQGGAILLDGDGRVVYYHQNESVSDHASTSELVQGIYKLLLTRDPLYQV